MVFLRFFELIIGMDKVLIAKSLYLVISDSVAGFRMGIRHQIPDAVLSIMIDFLQRARRIDHGEEPVTPGELVVSCIFQKFSIKQADKSFGSAFSALIVPFFPSRELPGTRSA